MNNQRRKALSALSARIEEIKSELESIMEEEQEAYDNMPESFQEGERGEKAQEAIDALDTVNSSLEEAMDAILEATN